MKAFVRQAVVLLACISIPMQATAALVACGPVHHGDVVGVFATVGNDSRTQQADAPASQRHELPAADGATGTDAGECGTCAACCAGSLMPLTNARFIAAIGNFEFAPSPLLTASSVTPRAIERPPLSLPT